MVSWLVDLLGVVFELKLVYFVETSILQLCRQIYDSRAKSLFLKACSHRGAHWIVPLLFTLYLHYKKTA